MKKLSFLALLVIISLLISCGDDNKKKVPPNDDDEQITDVETDDDDGNTGDTGDTGETGSTGGETGSTGETGNTGNDDDENDEDTDEDEDNDEDVVTPDPCHLCNISNRKCVEQSEDVWICTGCKDGYYENNDDMCVAKGALGAACDLAEYNNKDCLGGKCVDGVCCDSDCTGLCESCNVSDFYKGYCTPIPAGTDPGNECAAEDAATCGRNGFCDGAGACQFYSNFTVCQDAYCKENNSVEAAYCDGLGACDNDALTATPCTPYTCDTNIGYCVGGACTEHGDCSDGYYCDGTCVPKKVVGSLCNEDTECATSACVLDDFGTSGLKYCIPNKTSFCAKDGWYYDDGMSFCDPVGGTSYKECVPASWGSKKSCPNTTQKKCKPVGWASDCGYLLPDSCSNGSSGHTCVADANCKACEKTYRIKNTISPTPTIIEVTSTYAFGFSSCRQTCLAKDTPEDLYCGQQNDITNPGQNSHFCYKGELAKEETPIGVCIKKLRSGEYCQANNWCRSNKCSRTTSKCL